jgi:hypothetical protein
LAQADCRGRAEHWREKQPWNFGCCGISLKDYIKSLWRAAAEQKEPC